MTDEQLERYSRHIILKEIGVEGQKRLLESRALIIGAGGLGSPAALYLAAAGVGTIGIADPDTVSLSNLQRQIIHTTEDAGKAKVQSAQEKIRALNPDVTVVPYLQRIDAGSIADIIENYDFIIDGTDNFSAKFLINDACVLRRKPFCHAGIIRFQGQIMTYIPGESPCYRCVFHSPPPEGAVPACQQAGVLGATAGVIGTLQATEALKFLLGMEGLLKGQLLCYNALTMEFRKTPLSRNPDCPVCGTKPSVTALIDSGLPKCSA
jgi:molybdopterin/thiamine biosynthesis adenylyltransferase